MNKRLVGNYIGGIMCIEAAFMIPALIIAIYNNEMPSLKAFAITMAALVTVGAVLMLVRPRDSTFYSREGFITVALSWIILSAFGAIPFTVSGAIPSYVDAFFETVSGFTTTGASILTEVESLPRSVLYWRSFTHWLGGMGVLVFMLAVMPRSSGSGVSLHILRAESPGPSVGKLVPKIRHTARLLYLIYILMTVILVILLLCGGMSVFDSVTTAFGTAGTGGFGIKNDSMAGYNYYLQGVVSVFMILFGVNFSIYHLLIMRDFRHAFRDSELRLYFGIIGFSVIAITINVLPLFDSIFEAFHHSLFQVASIITTTGFATADFNLWPQFSRCLLVILMILGASAGSTGGGIKTARLIILVKSLQSSIQKMMHPRSVKTIKIDDKTLDDNTVSGVHIYMTAYVLIAAASVLVLSLENFDFETTVTAVIACLNNIGPGLGMVGATGNYSQFSVVGKLILSADMLLGRLELFPLILMFAPSVWKRSK